GDMLKARATIRRARGTARQSVMVRGGEDEEAFVGAAAASAIAEAVAADEVAAANRRVRVGSPVGRVSREDSRRWSSAEWGRSVSRSRSPSTSRSPPVVTVENFDG
ncbi:hypothetical protein HK097_003786, partial [Rhizophlyctis rosea]